jgi:hypothetical protein
MDDIVTKDGIFKYRWQPDFLGKKGCDVCHLKRFDEYCPKEKCTKDGCYVIMTQRERLNERIQKWLDEKKLKKQQELDNK